MAPCSKALTTTAVDSAYRTACLGQESSLSFQLTESENSSSLVRGSEGLPAVEEWKILAGSESSIRRAEGDIQSRRAPQLSLHGHSSVTADPLRDETQT